MPVFRLFLFLSLYIYNTYLHIADFLCIYLYTTCFYKFVCFVSLNGQRNPLLLNLILLS